MASEGENTKLINKDNSDFPAYLDFEKLRTEGIAYLGKLSGKIWTDHNVHDPGITILEVLCYSLLDLGYRTNLPAIDLFSRDPLETGQDNNFFTAGQILTCNPLTILDYRKFLIDINGVKNAWLEIADDQYDLCKNNNQYFENIQQSSCVEFLNGLYHVFIEPEKDINTDFTDEDAARFYIDDLNKRIKDQLMSHRNFCEDFVDISFLCKLDVGVCASIELLEEADLEKTYREIIQKLRDFISPSTKFYTLQELLDKGKSIEDIYAGRPSNLVESHGFIDTDELDQIKLKKEIHLSDLYQIILGIEGVKSVNNLSIKNCSRLFNNSSEDWKFKIPKNYVLNFSVECSGIQFRKNGIPLDFDDKKFYGIFNLNFSHAGKVLYGQGSAYLDRPIPTGNYHEDLDEYFLLQDDFPRVYGISEGGLAENASNQRKAQALQLKGYLLFFDQILAGFLAQLKNMRTLFSMTSSSDINNRRTYFLNQLDEKPELSKLLRFAVGSDSSESLGAEGNTLVRIVDNKQLEQLITDHSNQLDQLETYKFGNLSKQQVAIHQLMEDFTNNNFTYGFISNQEGEIQYYVKGSSDDFALLSKISFQSNAAANLHLNSITYVGTFEENYRSYIIDENQVSFDIELNISTFKSYLALIIEDQDLYSKRRNTFLNHLLSRFAERFTDNVLDQFSQESMHLIQAKEDFLSNYDQISSNRGKAYDYLKDNWNNDNISGFEIEAKYLAGIKNKQLHSLCNFVVERLDDYYVVELSIADEAYFKLSEKFDSSKEAEEAAQLAFDSLANPEKLKTRYVAHEKMYNIVLQYDDRTSVPFFKQYATSQEADDVRVKLNRMFSKSPIEDVYISSYAHKVQLVDYKDQIIRKSIESFDSESSALDSGSKTMSKINDQSLWAEDDLKGVKVSQLYFNNIDPENPSYLDVKAFKININNTIVGKPDKFTYDILDHSNSFKIYAANEFSSNKEAKANAYLVLTLATKDNNYVISRNSIDSKYQLKIMNQDAVEAVCNSEFDTEEDAKKLRDIITESFNQSSYRLATSSFPKGWKFNYELGYDMETNFKFSSSKEYLYKEDAVKASTAFQQAIPSLKLANSKNGIILTQQNKGSKLPTVNLESVPENPEDRITKALGSQKNIAQYSSSNKAQIFKSAVKKETNDNDAKYVYRLVDKDRVLAYYIDQYQSKEEANLAKMKVSKLLKKNLRYLQLCLGGQIIKEVFAKNQKSKVYKFQLRAHNILYKKAGPIQEELILFESVKSYANKELALEAFEESYFQILELAAVESNYGTIISFDENVNTNSASLVYIPTVTQEELKYYDGAPIPQILMQLVKSYPIKRRDDLFYFETYNSEKNPQSWHSVQYYSTAEEAMNDFNFFLMLLKYSGNLFVDCDFNDDGKGDYRIYIREVLAESTNRYYSEEEAWGETGVQNLICAIQSDLGFRKYQKKEDCCFSFYLNCGEDFLIHPCTYDTAKKRNQVIVELYEQFKRYVELNSYSFSSEKGSLLFNDEYGKPFAIKNVERVENQESCDLLFNILEELQNADNHYEIVEEIVIVKNKEGQLILQSYSKGWTIETFKEVLDLFLCFFPISRTKNQIDNTYQYHLEIKLPGYNSCKDEFIESCGCNEQVASEPTCYIAWKTACPVSSCSMALRLMFLTNYLLSNFENYQAILDCSCNTFGIAINFNVPEFREGSFVNGKQIAFNPQCYQTSKELCVAVERTKELSNAEGLHVVEHILLRPRCPEDCQTRSYENYISDEKPVNLSWKADHEDPCSTESDICFRLGEDPYSFISTVLLPAWPKRFRSQSGRLMLEDILYRLAPAHVMLRILWLAPHDFCCFENKYKNWRKWIARKRTCDTEFEVDELLDLLFRRNFEELEDCTTCLPCGQDKEVFNPCFYREYNQDSAIQNTFLNQVNQEFNWRVSFPAEYRFISCEQIQDAIYRDQKKIHDQPEEIEKKEQIIKTAVVAKKPVKRADNKQLNILKEKRLMAYRTTVGQVAEKLKRNVVIQNVQKYMADPALALSQLEPIVTQIIENKKTTAKNYVVLNKPQMKKVLETVVSYALDHLNYKTKSKSDLNILEGTFEKLRKAKVDVSAIYTHWDGTELKKYQPKINVIEIKNLLAGKTK